MLALFLMHAQMRTVKASSLLLSHTSDSAFSTHDLSRMCAGGLQPVCGKGATPQHDARSVHGAALSQHVRPRGAQARQGAFMIPLAHNLCM